MTRRLPRWLRYCLTATLILATVWVWAWLGAGGPVAWTLILALVGLFAVVAAVMGITGLSATHHAKSEERAIARVEASRARRQLVEGSRR